MKLTFDYRITVDINDKAIEASGETIDAVELQKVFVESTQASLDQENNDLLKMTVEAI